MSSYIALYRKWRPSIFEDVIGQEHITDVLRGELRRGSVSHAYLFCGSRGTGKTTCAKILAKAVSCENLKDGDPCGECESCKRSGASFDISEIDAASNNGVDNIRELREEVLYPPTELKRRVYIIDEVHMLSPGAFNALLKTLEEPPEHAMFILATTELNKIPATILSRCKRFDFHRITPENIAKRLRFICNEEKIPMTDGALMLVARLAGGAMRDALSMLELFVGKNEEITEEICAKTLGVIGRGPVMKLLSAVCENDCQKALSVISEAYSGSKDMGVLLSECADAVRDMLMIKYTSNPEKFVEGSSDVIAELSKCAKNFTKERLLYSMQIIDDAQNRLARTSFSRRAVLETCVIKLCDVKLWALPESLSTRISELEDKLSGGGFTVASPTIAKAEVLHEQTFEAEGIPFDEPPFDIENAEPPLSDASIDIPDLPKNKAPKNALSVKKPDSEGGTSPISAMPEILEEIRAKDKICASLISGAKGYAVGNTKVVITVSSFAINMLKNDSKKMDVIIASVKKLMGDVEVKIAPEGEKAPDEWDL